MKFLHCFLMGCCLAFCVACISSVTVDVMPAQAKERGVKSEKNKKTPTAKKEKQSVSSHKKPSRKAAKASRRTRRDADRGKAVSSRELWMRRAKGSEMMTGKASWYGIDSHGGATASGVSYDMYTFTAAHRTLPIGTIVKVTGQDSGKSVMVCVTDRGPFIRSRIIDLSMAAAEQIDIRSRGVGDVNLEVVSDSRGTPLNPGQAYYIRYKTAADHNVTKVGPFRAFSDAAAMHEALLLAHPEARVVLE